jgi:hypothetical protein
MALRTPRRPAGPQPPAGTPQRLYRTRNAGAERPGGSLRAPSPHEQKPLAAQREAGATWRASAALTGPPTAALTAYLIPEQSAACHSHAPSCSACPGRATPSCAPLPAAGGAAGGKGLLFCLLHPEPYVQAAHCRAAPCCAPGPLPVSRARGGGARSCRISRRCRAATAAATW